jgi:hypothetical protein
MGTGAIDFAKDAPHFMQAFGRSRSRRAVIPLPRWSWGGTARPAGFLTSFHKFTFTAVFPEGQKIKKGNHFLSKALRASIRQLNQFCFFQPPAKV